jgi:hypothetical protein
MAIHCRAVKNSLRGTLVHSEIFYVPVDDGWEEVLVRNVLHYVPISR